MVDPGYVGGVLAFKRQMSAPGPVSQEEELKDSILLVFANKQDQQGALGAKHVSTIVPRPSLS